MHVNDVAGNPDLFVKKNEQHPEVEKAVEAISAAPTPPPAPTPISAPKKESVLRDLVTDAIAVELEKQGIKTLKDVTTKSMATLQKVPGLTVHKARKLREAARARLSE